MPPFKLDLVIGDAVAVEDRTGIYVGRQLDRVFVEFGDRAEWVPAREIRRRPS